MKRSAPSSKDVSFILQNVLGCKWTLHILAMIRTGVNRPGELSRSAEGLTTKVLNERLSKLVRFHILEKISYPETPPRVEYHITEFGTRFSRLLDEIDRLQKEITGSDSSAPPQEAQLPVAGG